MKFISNALQPKTCRTGVLHSICATSVLASLIAPMAVYAQPAKIERSTDAHATHAGGIHHGSEMKSMMKDINDKMVRMNMTGNPDVDFAQMMRIHHVGAIDMAEMQLKNGKDASMRKMAQEVIRAQKKEIATIDRFLAKQGSFNKGS